MKAAYIVSNEIEVCVLATLLTQYICMQQLQVPIHMVAPAHHAVIYNSRTGNRQSDLGSERGRVILSKFEART